MSDAMLPFQIRLGPAGREASIQMGGLDVSNYVRSLSFSSGVDKATVITVEFIKVEIDAEGYSDVTGMGDQDRNYVEAKQVKGTPA